MAVRSDVCTWTARVIVEYNDITGLWSRGLYGPSCDVVSSARDKEMREFRYSEEADGEERERGGSFIFA